jgi:hypothetical protein
MKLLERERTELWSVPPRLFNDEVLILGGGPSLKWYDWSRLPAWTSIIAINDAYRRALKADVLYFADELWGKANKDDINATFEGRLVVTRQPLSPSDARVVGSRLRVVDRGWGCNLSRSPSHLSGFDGGSNAINLAYLGGAKRILLLGFDMRPGSWHGRSYPDSCPDTHYDRFFMPSHRGMAEELEKTECEVINITPGSALQCYRSQQPEAFGIVRMDR